MRCINVRLWWKIKMVSLREIKATSLGSKSVFPNLCSGLALGDLHDDLHLEMHQKGGPPTSRHPRLLKWGYMSSGPDTHWSLQQCGPDRLMCLQQRSRPIDGQTVRGLYVCEYCTCLRVFVLVHMCTHCERVISRVLPSRN